MLANFSAFSQVADSLYRTNRYNVNDLTLDIGATAQVYNKSIVFFNRAFSEASVLDTDNGSLFTYGKKYFTDTTKFSNTPLMPFFRQIKINEDVFKQAKMDRFLVQNVDVNDKGIFLLLRVPKLLTEDLDSGKQRFIMSYELAIAEVSPEKIISCEFIKKELDGLYERDKPYQIQYYNAFCYKKNEYCLLSLFLSGFLYLPESILMASFATKDNLLVFKEKKQFNGKQLLDKSFNREHLYTSYKNYPFMWYDNEFGQLIHLEKNKIYNIAPLLKKHSKTSECTIIDAKILNDKQLGVITRGDKTDMQYSIFYIKKNGSLSLSRILPLTIFEKNLNPKTWVILASKQLAHCDYDNYLNIYSIEKKKE